jgi:hypothetical protein
MQVVDRRHRIPIARFVVNAIVGSILMTLLAWCVLSA